MKGEGATFRQMVPKREGVTKVVGLPGKRDQQNQSIRIPLIVYRLSGTDRR